MPLKQELEAILFLKNQPTTLKELSEISGAKTKDVKASLLELNQDYIDRDSSLYISSHPQGYIIDIKKDFQHIAQKLLPTNLRTSELRTLTTIILQSPILQREVVRQRGSSAYQHIKELLSQHWIIREESENGFVIKTTPQCLKYFNLSKEGKELKEKLKNIETNINETSLSNQYEYTTSSGK